MARSDRSPRSGSGSGSGSRSHSKRPETELEADPQVRLQPRPVAPGRALSLQGVSALLRAASLPSRHHCAALLALRDRALLELLFATALRASESCAVLLVDLDLVGGALRVRPVKRGRPRTLPLPALTVRHLRAYLDQARPRLARHGRDQGHLLLSLRGRPLHRSLVREIVVRAARRADLHAYPHMLRHSLATALLRAGVPVPAIQHLLGHHSLAATQHYLALDPHELRQAVDLLARPLA